MEKVNLYNQQDPEQWNRQNHEALKNMHDDALKAIIPCVLNLHELEHTSDWKKSGRRLDYSNLIFEAYLQNFYKK